MSDLRPGEARHLLLYTITDMRSLRAAIAALREAGIIFNYVVLPESLHKKIFPKGDYSVAVVGDIHIQFNGTDERRKFILKTDL